MFNQCLMGPNQAGKKSYCKTNAFLGETLNPSKSNRYVWCNIVNLRCIFDNIIYIYIIIVENCQMHPSICG